MTALFVINGINQLAHLSDPIGRKSTLLCMLAYGGLIGGEVDAINLIVGHVAV